MKPPLQGAMGVLGAVPVPREDRAMDALLWLCPQYLPARSTHADGGLNSPTVLQPISGEPEYKVSNSVPLVGSQIMRVGDA